jgi:hypothetical protein
MHTGLNEIFHIACGPPTPLLQDGFRQYRNSATGATTGRGDPPTAKRWTIKSGSTGCLTEASEVFLPETQQGLSDIAGATLLR